MDIRGPIGSKSALRLLIVMQEMKKMNTGHKWLFLSGLLFMVAIGYVGHSYYATEREAHRKAHSKFNFLIEPEHVREIGYVWDLRVTRHLMDHEKKILWWIKIPGTNKTYSCSWEAGFPEYEKNEGVVLIHMPGGTDSSNWYGYIIGLHGLHEGKQTLVWALDIDDLDYD